eukprot:scaffold42750_cov21-Tisochrysis_lutea.AAC.1
MKRWKREDSRLCPNRENNWERTAGKLSQVMTSSKNRNLSTSIPGLSVMRPTASTLPTMLLAMPSWFANAYTCSGVSCCAPSARAWNCLSWSILGALACCTLLATLD